MSHSPSSPSSSHLFILNETSCQKSPAQWVSGLAENNTGDPDAVTQAGCCSEVVFKRWKQAHNQKVSSFRQWRNKCSKYNMESIKEQTQEHVQTIWWRRSSDKSKYIDWVREVWVITKVHNCNRKKSRDILWVSDMSEENMDRKVESDLNDILQEVITWFPMSYAVPLNKVVSVSLQEPVIQPPRKDSSVFHPQVLTGSCLALHCHQQISQT